jgi:hypothetical protein
MKILCDSGFLSWQKLIRTVLAIGVLSMFSCAPNPPSAEGEILTVTQNEKLITLLDELNVTDKISKILLIIPTTGCVKCIDVALTFVSQNQGKKDLSVIVSTYSAKSATLKLKKYNIDERNIIGDNKALAVKYDLINIFPVLLRLNGKNETYFKQLEADNGSEILEKIKSEL